MLDDSFKQRIRLGRLYDDDLSLAEIAAELDVSRQAVHDLIHRVEQILERYETKMKLLEREEKQQLLRMEACRLLDGYIKTNNTELLKRLKNLLKDS